MRTAQNSSLPVDPPEPTDKEYAIEARADKIFDAWVDANDINWDLATALLDIARSQAEVEIQTAIDDNAIEAFEDAQAMLP